MQWRQAAEAMVTPRDLKKQAKIRKCKSDHMHKQMCHEIRLQADRIRLTVFYGACFSRLKRIHLS